MLRRLLRGLFVRLRDRGLLRRGSWCCLLGLQRIITRRCGRYAGDRLAVDWECVFGTGLDPFASDEGAVVQECGIF